MRFFVEMTHSNDIIKIVHTHRNYTPLLAFSIIQRARAFRTYCERIIYS